MSPLLFLVEVGVLILFRSRYVSYLVSRAIVDGFLVAGELLYICFLNSFVIMVVLIVFLSGLFPSGTVLYGMAAVIAGLCEGWARWVK